MVRIGVDARPLETPINGIGRYLTKTLQYMAAGGDTWFLYSNQAIEASNLFPGEIRTRHADIHRSISGTISAQCLFAKWAKADEVDVFWSPRHHLPMMLGASPSVLTVHDMVWRRAPRTMIRLGMLSEKLLMPRSLRQATKILVPSFATAADIAEFYPWAAGKTTVIPLAADLSFSSGAMNTNRAVLGRFALFVGTFEPRKNLARVIDAFIQATNRHGIAQKLVIVGGGGWKNADVLSRLQRYRSDSRIVHLGRVSDAELANLYASADFLIAPSLYEGFGLQVVEALEAGTPVITSNIASMPEVAGGAALLVDPYSTNGIAEAIQLLTVDYDLRTALANAARTKAAEFSWQKTADETLTQLRNAAAGS